MGGTDWAPPGRGRGGGAHGLLGAAGQGWGCWWVSPGAVTERGGASAGGGFFEKSLSSSEQQQPLEELGGCFSLSARRRRKRRKKRLRLPPLRSPPSPSPSAPHLYGRAPELALLSGCLLRQPASEGRLDQQPPQPGLHGAAAPRHPPAGTRPRRRRG